jgi:hypothetical protein
MANQKGFVPLVWRTEQRPGEGSAQGDRPQPPLFGAPHSTRAVSRGTKASPAASGSGLCPSIN